MKNTNDKEQFLQSDKKNSAENLSFYIKSFFISMMVSSLSVIFSLVSLILSPSTLTFFFGAETVSTLTFFFGAETVSTLTFFSGFDTVSLFRF